MAAAAARWVETPRPFADMGRRCDDIVPWIALKIMLGDRRGLHVTKINCRNKSEPKLQRLPFHGHAPICICNLDRCQQLSSARGDDGNGASHGCSDSALESFFGLAACCSKTCVTPTKPDVSPPIHGNMYPTKRFGPNAGVVPHAPERTLADMASTPFKKCDQSSQGRTRQCCDERLCCRKHFVPKGLRSLRDRTTGQKRHESHPVLAPSRPLPPY